MDQAKQHEVLGEFLAEAGLSQHFDTLVNKLKVHSLAQIKYVHKEDLTDVGIPKIDAQRLLKHSQKSRHGALSKFKKVVFVFILHAQFSCCILFCHTCNLV